MNSNTHTTREAWLIDVTRHLDSWFRSAGFPLPADLRVTCGFPSARARNGRIGECWSASCSADNTVEVMISPILSSPSRVADVLAHELIHAAVGVSAGHKGPFRELAKSIGLEGKMTATIAGEAFKRLIAPILDSVGPYPHAELNARGATSGPKKQSTRLLKATCGECGYTVRVTRKWVEEVGAPHCPEHGEMNID